MDMQIDVESLKLLTFQQLLDLDELARATGETPELLAAISRELADRRGQRFGGTGSP